MGQSSSRIARRTFPKAPATNAAPPPSSAAARQGAVAGDAATQAAAEPPAAAVPHALEFEDGRDDDLGRMLAQLSGAIRDVKEPEVKLDPALMRRKYSKEERAALQVGRLATKDARALLEDVNSAALGGGRADDAELARRYGATAEVVAALLRYCRVPVVEQAEDGTKTGRWV